MNKIVALLREGRETGRRQTKRQSVFIYSTGFVASAFLPHHPTNALRRQDRNECKIVIGNDSELLLWRFSS